jgi:hypothetical protein
LLWFISGGLDEFAGNPSGKPIDLATHIAMNRVGQFRCESRNVGIGDQAENGHLISNDS